MILNSQLKQSATETTANLFSAGDEATSHSGGTVHPFSRIISMETHHKAKLADGEVGLWRLRPLSVSAQFPCWVVHSARLQADIPARLE